MAMTNILSAVGYPNEVLESKFTDLLTTKLNARNFMTIDTSLAENAGMKKVINVYTYSGTVETVAEGNGNTVSGAVTYSPVEYPVITKQSHFGYTDEAQMTDPLIVDVSMRGSADLMVNDLTADFFTELGKATLEHGYTTFGYEAVVDGIALMNIEDEGGLFLIIGTGLKATIRKDSDFVSSKLGEILYTGQIGSICGVPVVVSKAVNANEAFIASKEAVTLFIKKDSEVEQERNANLRTNSVFLRKVGLVALTDATKAVKIAKAQTGTISVTTYTKEAKTVAGVCPAKCEVIEIYINGVLDGTTTFSTGDTDAYTYTAKDNLAIDDEVYAVAKQVGYVSKTSAKVTVTA